MKILMICTEKLPVPPILGGAIQTYISGVLPHLRNVHDITVLGISDPSLPDQETIDNISYIRVPGKIFELYQEGVTSYIQSHSFDLIHIFNRPRLVLPVRNVAPQAIITLSMHNDMFGVEKINSDEANAVLDEVSSIVTISNYVGNVIRNLYPQAASKIRTIYSGVDTDRFLPGSHPNIIKIRKDIRQAHGLENKTVILFAGRLSSNKGVDRLVRALPELSKKYDDLALVIVGSKWFSQDGLTDYIAYVKALAKKLSIPIVATGFVAPSEIQNWFAAADLFVCTSLWQEPLARVHYEAMAAGLPIITTARGGNAEVIEVGVNGLVVENPEDPSYFVEKISEVLSNKAWMKKMGEKGRETALLQYKWDRVASEILDVWTNSQQIVVATDVPSNTESVLEDVSINHLTEQSGNVTEEIPIISEMKENAFEVDSSMMKSNKKSKSEKDNKKSKSEKDNKKSKSEKDNKKSKSEKDNEKSKSEKDNKKSKSEKDNKKSKSEKDNKKSKSEKDNKKSKSEKDNKKSKSEKDNKKSKSEKDNKKSKSEKNNKKSKSEKDNKESTSDYVKELYRVDSSMMKSKKSNEKSKSKKDNKKSK